MVALRDLQRDVRRVVKGIQLVFSAQGDLQESEAEQLHELFVNCVEAVNTRLRKCDELLRRGLRQEALQECDSDPSILDLVTELDLPEWEAWTHYAGQFGLSAPPPLLIEVAAELNSEFTTAASLDSLLRNHRLHALARSPLTVRVTLLRKIAARDSANHVWKEDLASYETARLRQLGEEFRQRFAAKDLTGVEALRREVESDIWQSPPAKSLIEPIVRGHDQLVRAHARARLAKLSEAIDKQYAAFDLAALRRSQAEWDRYAANAALKSDEELAQQVLPAFEWLDQENEAEATEQAFQTAVGELEFALDSRTTSRHELLRLRTVAERFDQPIPERIVRRCDEQLKSLHRAERQRFRLMVGSVAGGLLVLAMVVALVIRWQLSVLEIGEAEGVLRRLVEAGSYRQAQDALEKLPDRVRSAAPIEGLAADISKRLREETARKERVLYALKQVNDSLTETWESVFRSKKQLVELEKEAATEDERMALAEVQGTVLDVEERLQTQVDDKFIEECKSLIEWMPMLQTADEAAIRERLATAKELAARAYVSSTAKQNGQIEAIVARLKSRADAMRTTAAERKARGDVVAGVNREPAFVAALESYIKEHPTEARSEDFQRALAEGGPSLAQVASWNEFVTAWPMDCWKVPAQASAALSALDEASGFADWREFQSISDQRPYLESVALRAAGVDSLWSELDGYLSKEWMLFWCLRTKSKELVYFSVEPEAPNSTEPGAAYRVKERKDIRDPGAIKNRRLAVSDLLPDNKGNYVLESPQRRFATSARELLKTMQSANPSASYEEASLDLLSMWLKQGGLDAILKTYCLHTFCAVLSDGSTLLEEGLEPLVRATETDDTLSDVNWLDRDDPTVQERRQSLLAKLERVGALQVAPDDLKPGLLARLEEVKKALRVPPQYFWVGVLMKDDAGHWVCEIPTSQRDVPQGRLVLLDPARADGAGFACIGAIEAQGAKLSEDHTALYYQGCPVFCEK